MSGEEDVDESELSDSGKEPSNVALRIRLGVFGEKMVTCNDQRIVLPDHTKVQLDVDVALVSEIFSQ